eukprot:2469303-Pyramimonas_sp.AAC.1
MQQRCTNARRLARRAASYFGASDAATVALTVADSPVRLAGFVDARTTQCESVIWAGPAS